LWPKLRRRLLLFPSLKQQQGFKPMRRPPAISQMRQTRPATTRSLARTSEWRHPQMGRRKTARVILGRRAAVQQRKPHGAQQRDDRNNSNRSVAPNNNAGQPPSNVQNSSNQPSTPGNADSRSPMREIIRTGPPASDNAGQPPHNVQNNSNRPPAPTAVGSRPKQSAWESDSKQCSRQVVSRPSG